MLKGQRKLNKQNSQYNLESGNKGQRRESAAESEDEENKGHNTQRSAFTRKNKSNRSSRKTLRFNLPPSSPEAPTKNSLHLLPCRSSKFDSERDFQRYFSASQAASRVYHVRVNSARFDYSNKPRILKISDIPFAAAGNQSVLPINCPVAAAPVLSLIPNKHKTALAKECSEMSVPSISSEENASRPRVITRRESILYRIHNTDDTLDRLSRPTTASQLKQRNTCFFCNENQELLSRWQSCGHSHQLEAGGGSSGDFLKRSRSAGFRRSEESIRDRCVINRLRQPIKGNLGCYKAPELISYDGFGVRPLSTQSRLLVSGLNKSTSVREITNRMHRNRVTSAF